METNVKIAEALYEIINGLHGYRSKQHTKWEKEAKTYIKKLTKTKNLSLDYGGLIEIDNENGTKTLYKIRVTKA